MDETQPLEDCVQEEPHELEGDKTAERRREPLAKLRLFKNEHLPETDIPLYLGENVLGRDPAFCSLPLSARSVSKQHAVISLSLLPAERDCDGLILEALLWDLGSMNGTWKGRLRLTPHVRYALGEGESVVLADLPCQYVSVGETEKLTVAEAEVGSRKARLRGRGRGRGSGKPVEIEERRGVENTKRTLGRRSEATTPSGIKAMPLSLGRTPAQPEMTLVPESESDSDGERRGGKERRGRLFVSDSDSPQISGPTCSTFLSPPGNVIPESEDESSITPGSSVKKQEFSRRECGGQSTGRPIRRPLVIADDSDSEIQRESSGQLEETTCKTDEQPGGVAVDDNHGGKPGSVEEGGQRFPRSCDTNVKMDPNRRSEESLPSKTTRRITALTLDSEAEMGHKASQQGAGPGTHFSSAGDKGNREPSSISAPDGSGTEKPAFYLDSDTDVEGEEEVGDLSGFSNSKTTLDSTSMLPKGSMVQSEQYHLDSDTDVENDVSTSLSVLNSSAKPVFTPAVLPIELQLDSDTDPEDNVSASVPVSNLNAKPASTPAAVPVELQLESVTAANPLVAAESKTLVVPGAKSSAAVAGEAWELQCDSDTDLEEEATQPCAPALMTTEGPPPRADSQPSAAGAERGAVRSLPGSDTAVEVTESDSVKRDLQAEYLPVPVVDPNGLNLDSDTDVEDEREDGPDSRAEESAGSPRVIRGLLGSEDDEQKCSTPLGPAVREEEMETQAFFSPSDPFRRPFLPPLSKSRNSEDDLDGANDDEFVVAETPTQLFVLDSPQALDSSPTEDLDAQPTQAFAYQLGLSDSVATECTEAIGQMEGEAELGDTSPHLREELEEMDEDLDATQAYGADLKDVPPVSGLAGHTESASGIQNDAIQAYSTGADETKEGEEDVNSHLSTAETQPVSALETGEGLGEGWREGVKEGQEVEEAQSSPQKQSGRLQRAKEADAPVRRSRRGRGGGEVEEEEEEESLLAVRRLTRGKAKAGGTKKGGGRRGRSMPEEDEECEKGLDVVLKEKNKGSGKTKSALNPRKERDMEERQIKEAERQLMEKEMLVREGEDREENKRLEKKKQEQEKRKEKESNEPKEQKPCERETEEKEETERREREEKEQEEKERLEREKKEPEEKERLEREQEEKERLEREAKERLEREKREQEERLEREKKEQGEKERLERDQEEKERLEREKKEQEEKERLERDQEEKERLERDQEEKERLEREQEEKERLEREQEEKERLEREEKKRLEREKKERLEKDQEEKERLEREKKEQEERLEREKKEQEEKERLEREEKKRLEREKKEQEEKERLEREKKEQEEKERLEREQEEKERLEREKKEQEEKERLEREQEEKERLEREKKEQEEKERLEREQEEKERLEREKKEQEEKERLEREQEEKERLEREQEEQEKKERLEREKKEQEKKERLEREKKEQEEKERLEKEKKEQEEKERLAKKERERLEREKREQEEKERLEKKEKEVERLEKERRERDERGKKKKESEDKKRLEKEKENEEKERNEEDPLAGVDGEQTSGGGVEKTRRGRARLESEKSQTSTGGRWATNRRTAASKGEEPKGSAEVESAPQRGGRSRSSSINSDKSSSSVATQQRGRGRKSQKSTDPDPESPLSAQIAGPLPPKPSGRGRKSGKVSGSGGVGAETEAQVDNVEEDDSEPCNVVGTNKGPKNTKMVEEIPSLNTPVRTSSRGKSRGQKTSDFHTTTTEADQTKPAAEAQSEEIVVSKLSGNSLCQKRGLEEDEEQGNFKVTRGRRKSQTAGKGTVEASEGAEKNEKREEAVKSAAGPAQKRGRASVARAKKHKQDEGMEGGVEEQADTSSVQRGRGRQAEAQRKTDKKDEKEQTEDHASTPNSEEQNGGVVTEVPQTLTGRISRKRVAQSRSPPAAKTPRRSAASVISPGTVGRNKSSAQAYKVLFTGVSDEAGEVIVSRLGGGMAKGVTDMTHLVTDKVRRTVKFLCAVARGVPVVTTDWLEKCGKAGSFLSPSPFLVKDAEQEKKFSFSLERSLQMAHTQPLLQGYEIHVTRSVKPDPAQMKDIISCSGARFLPKMPATHKAQTVVVSCAEDASLCSAALSASLPVLSAEFLLTGILQQKVDLVAHRLTGPGFEAGGKAASKGRRK